ncbi:MAG: hydrogenase expression/formation protein HypE [Pirellulaceae bacterium]
MTDNTMHPSKQLPVALSCPIERSSDCVLLAHGEGGRLMRQLLRERIVPILGISAEEDAVSVEIGANELAITTDSFVVSPLFFPGGNIGSLAVYGTVNDLSVAGADPICITLSLIIEEGLPFELFDRVLKSIAEASQECQVSVVAGDTKVVPRGAADKLFITTTGVGRYRAAARLSCHKLQTGDALIVSGPIGQHGIAVLAAREKLNLHPAPHSDSANLSLVCSALHRELGTHLRAMRDATRGGVSAVLHEWSSASGMTMKLDEHQLPVGSTTRGVCELLGLDPLYVANEGTFVAAVEPSALPQAMAVLRSFPVSAKSQVIGTVLTKMSSPVVIERLLGSLQPVDEPSGAPLPRIC